MNLGTLPAHDKLNLPAIEAMIEKSPSRLSGGVARAKGGAMKGDP